MNILGANLKKDGTEEDESAIPVNIPNEYGLDQNYPNPFNPSTTINYQLPQNGFVNISVYDILGNLVTTLVNEETNAGYHSITWNAQGFSSGIYFYTIRTGSFLATKKLVLLK